MWLLTRGTAGFHSAVWYGTLTVALGTVIRTVPCFFSASFRATKGSIVMLHIGQFFIGASGPFVMVSRDIHTTIVVAGGDTEYLCIVRLFPHPC